ncbi:phosphomannose isomerase type I domain-containing protein [Sarocladium implicatum]|nr:phosphomannose isomerase type I domain-containing protein [Sarocladium implicatum]
MATPLEPFYQLKCSCNEYPWGKQGSKSLAATLCAKTPGWTRDGPSKVFEIDENTTYAEMWMGTYPEMPSYVISTGEDLQAVLDRYPSQLLGDKVTSKFGHTNLPYLPKVLSIAKALPLQIHPNKDFAAKKHKEDPDDFTDPNHKPEIALALGEFEAFCGFKPLADVASLLNLEPLQHLRGIGNAASGSFKDEDLRHVVQKILEADDQVIRKTYKDLMALPESSFTSSPANAHIPELAPRLADQFSEADPGILVGLITMNYLKLQAGDAVYIPADGIHAYISGDIIECMARSNNVLNTGLCPKAERSNAKQFCDLLTFAPHDAEQCMLPAKGYPRSENGKTKMYKPPLSEFNVLQTELAKGEKEVLGKGGASILIATKGGADVSCGDKSFKLEEGHIYFVSQGVRMDIKAADSGLLMHTAYVD